MAFYFSRRKIKPKEDEESGELNIIPYLDILMNLIIFMLLSMAGLATFGMINVNAPEYGGGGLGGDQEKPPLTLTVAIARSGFFIGATGGILPGVSESGATPGQGAPAIPKKADGTYDYAALTAMMGEIKSKFQDENKVVIAADADIDYETLVATMDATRETADRKRLFPDVTLSTF